MKALFLPILLAAAPVPADRARTYLLSIANISIDNASLGCVDGFNQHQPARKTDDG